MITFRKLDIEKNTDNQKKWFEKISQDNTQYYWIIEVKEQPIGLISLNQIDYHNKKHRLRIILEI